MEQMIKDTLNHFKKLATKDLWKTVGQRSKKLSTSLVTKLLIKPFRKLVTHLTPKNDEGKIDNFIVVTIFGAVIFAILAVLLFFSYPLQAIEAGSEKMMAQLGTIGDFFGGILNPTFAFMGLMALLYTLRLNQKELTQATQQMAKSAEAAQLQVKQDEIHHLLDKITNEIDEELSQIVHLNDKDKTTMKYSFFLDRDYMQDNEHSMNATITGKGLATPNAIILINSFCRLYELLEAHYLLSNSEITVSTYAGKYSFQIDALLSCEEFYNYTKSIVPSAIKALLILKLTSGEFGTEKSKKQFRELQTIITESNLKPTALNQYLVNYYDPLFTPT